MIRALKKHSVTDHDLFRVQENVETFSRQLTSNPHISGVLLERVELVAGENRIPHKLGRALKGWHLTRVRTAATVHDDQDSLSQGEQTTTLLLVSSTAVTVDLWVF